MCDAIMSLHVQHRIAMMLNEAAIWRIAPGTGSGSLQRIFGFQRVGDDVQRCSLHVLGAIRGIHRDLPSVRALSQFQLHTVV